MTKAKNRKVIQTSAKYFKNRNFITFVVVNSKHTQLCLRDVAMTIMFYRPAPSKIEFSVVTVLFEFFIFNILS